MSNKIHSKVDFGNSRSSQTWAEQVRKRLNTENYTEVSPQGSGGVADFENNWVNFDGTRRVRFYKDGAGVVHLAGIAKSGTVASPIFTLPAGYIPDYLDPINNVALFAVPSNSAFGLLAVNNLGQVSLYAGSNAWVSLDGITFRAAE